MAQKWEVLILIRILLSFPINAHLWWLLPMPLLISILLKKRSLWASWCVISLLPMSFISSWLVFQFVAVKLCSGTNPVFLGSTYHPLMEQWINTKTGQRKEVLTYVESVWLTRTFPAFRKLQYFGPDILLKSTPAHCVCSVKMSVSPLGNHS